MPWVSLSVTNNIHCFPIYCVWFFLFILYYLIFPILLWNLLCLLAHISSWDFMMRDTRNHEGWMNWGQGLYLSGLSLQGPNSSRFLFCILTSSQESYKPCGSFHHPSWFPESLSTSLHMVHLLKSAMITTYFLYRLYGYTTHLTLFRWFQLTFKNVPLLTKKSTSILEVTMWQSSLVYSNHLITMFTSRRRFEKSQVNISNYQNLIYFIIIFNSQEEDPLILLTLSCWKVLSLDLLVPVFPEWK